MAAIPFEQCPAKTWTQPDGSVVEGRSVLNHCQIVGETARCLIARFPEPMRSRLFPVGSEIAAGGHDIGKVSPSFVAKILRACGIDFKTLPELTKATPDLESQWGGHAGVSQATAEELGTPKYVAEILGQHHGFNPNVDDKRGDAEVFGGNAWFDERKKLVAALKDCLNSDWPVVEHAAQARIIAGLTSTADWIGSGKFFEDPTQDWQPNINAALNDAGFIKPVIKQGLSFIDVFDPIKRQMQPRKAQTLFLDQITGPGIYILEAQMGMGKTEAALYAAYQLLAQQKATGIYFALPTQLTSNKIYDRFNAFLDQILGPDTPNRALLLHSGAWLLEHSDMGEDGAPGGAWFNQSKRGLLAPFAVGTIDQALMAVMNVKHGFVRAFGLAGKVVILDEVHSYDLYTGTILNELVAFLRQIECTVIILSATLSQSRRNALLQQATVSSAYPLVTAVSSMENTVVTEMAVPTEDSQSITLTSCRNDHQALEEALRRAQQGQQVLWIENTVTEAQQRYLDMASRAVQLGCDIGLLHSRFTPQDRAVNEAKWVKLFGRSGWSQRPHQGRILIGTQVLEQSLDIDADFLVSRFAPTDMLLQRIGRLWRHSDTPRHACALPDCWLLTPAMEQALINPRAAFGLSAMVYSPYVLCRSLEAWQSLSVVALPSGIRPLIDQTYAERLETDEWSVLLHELTQGTRFHTGEEAQLALARLTLSKGGKTLPEHKAETRYSDQDTHDVLLLSSLRIDAGETRMRLLDGRELKLPHSRQRLSKAGWRTLAVALNQQLVRVSPANCPARIAKHTLEKLHLHEVFYLGKPEDDEALLRVALVSPSGELQTLDSRPAGEKHILEYRNDLGYRALSNKE
ncbi:CRISPR-associated helicase Cas3' [Oceanobacter antarcticus]|uniref:CRISPR-associated helicase Cas3 n=1 Tax=Oceanobacter antarcticus TaxID=3133425 RepID=A0ABW8NIQ5_9GAMM